MRNRQSSLQPLVGLAFWTAVLYTIYHFVAKLW